jgi:hypothetical protein
MRNAETSTAHPAFAVRQADNDRSRGTRRRPGSPTSLRPGLRRPATNNGTIRRSFTNTQARLSLRAAQSPGRKRRHRRFRTSGGEIAWPRFAQAGPVGPVGTTGMTSGGGGGGGSPAICMQTSAVGNGAVTARPDGLSFDSSHSGAYRGFRTRRVVDRLNVNMVEIFSHLVLNVRRATSPVVMYRAASSGRSGVFLPTAGGITESGRCEARRQHRAGPGPPRAFEGPERPPTAKIGHGVMRG